MLYHSAATHELGLGSYHWCVRAMDTPKSLLVKLVYPPFRDQHIFGGESPGGTSIDGHWQNAPERIQRV